MILIDISDDNTIDLTNAFPRADYIFLSGVKYFTEPKTQQRQDGPFIYAGGIQGRRLSIVNLYLKDSKMPITDASPSYSRINYISNSLNRYKSRDPSKTLNEIYAGQPGMLELINNYNNLEKKYRFERIIFQLQDNNKLGIVVHSKNTELINSYISAKDEEVFKQKIITNFNKLFEENSLVNKLTFDEKISIMKWRASQPSGCAVPLSLQFSRKYRIGFCGDWFEGDGFGRVEGSILSALILEKKIRDLIK